MEGEKNFTSDDPSVSLTIRLIMQGKVQYSFITYFYFDEPTTVGFAAVFNILRDICVSIEELFVNRLPTSWKRVVGFCTLKTWH